jgi:hypothetical protein
LDQLGEVPGAVGHDQLMGGLGLVEEGEGVMTGVDDASAACVQGIAGPHQVHIGTRAAVAVRIGSQWSRPHFLHTRVSRVPRVQPSMSR